jgi:CBS-domain-containing membrane protein
MRKQNRTTSPMAEGRTPEGRLSWLRLRYMAPSPMEMRRRRLQIAAWALLGSLAAMGVIVACSYIGRMVFRG